MEECLDYYKKVNEVLKSKECLIKNEIERDRYEKELKFLRLEDNYKQAETLYIYYLLNEFAKANNEVCYFGGHISALYLSYMLGITPYNPVEHRLYPEILLSIDAKKPIISNFICSNVFREKCISFLKEVLTDKRIFKVDFKSQRDYYIAIIDKCANLDDEKYGLYIDGDYVRQRNNSDYILNLLVSFTCSYMMFSTDEYIEYLSINTKADFYPELTELVNSFNILKQSNKLDLVDSKMNYFNGDKYLTLQEISKLWCKGNVYYKNPEKALHLVIYREQLLDEFLDYNVPAEVSYFVLDEIRKAKFVNEFRDYLKQFNLSESFISDCENIKYLYSMAAVLTMLTPILYKAYYECYRLGYFAN